MLRFTLLLALAIGVHDAAEGVDNFGLNYFWFDAHSAGSTSTMDDFSVRNLDTDEIVYSNSFDLGLDGLRTWFQSDGDQPWTDSSPMTGIVSGQLRLETTGFGQNGAGGYDSFAAVVLEQRLPENFELSFVTQRLQWAGHSAIIFYTNMPNSPEASLDYDLAWGPTAGTKFEGNWGWDIHTFYPFHGWQMINVDARNVTNVRFVKQDATLEYYINGALIDSAVLEPHYSTIPEPTTFALWLLGLAAIGIRHRRNTGRSFNT